MTPLKKAFDDCTGTAWTMKSAPGQRRREGSVVARTDLGGSSYCREVLRVSMRLVDGSGVRVRPHEDDDVQVSLVPREERPHRGPERAAAHDGHLFRAREDVLFRGQVRASSRRPPDDLVPALLHAQALVVGDALHEALVRVVRRLFWSVRRRRGSRDERASATTTRRAVVPQSRAGIETRGRRRRFRRRPARGRGARRRDARVVRLVSRRASRGRARGGRSRRASGDVTHRRGRDSARGRTMAIRMDKACPVKG